MAKNVIINNNTYNSVPYVEIPIAGSSTGAKAKFVDTDVASSEAASSATILNGKKAFVNGDEVTGNISTKTASDVTVSDKTVTTPAGYYASQVQKSVGDGQLTPQATVEGGSTSATQVIGDTQTDYPVKVTPTANVTRAGWITSGTKTGGVINKYVQVETKTATPSTSQQTITPTVGHLLKQVTVNAVSLTGNATAADVLNGKTFYSSSLTKLTGTATVPTVSQDSTTHVLTIQ